MNQVIEFLIYWVGALAIVAALLWGLLWLIGKIFQLLGYHKVLVEAIWHIYRQRHEKRKK